MDRTVAVPGGSGKLGRAVVAALIQEGWTMINFDRVPCRTVGPVSSAAISAPGSKILSHTGRWTKMSRLRAHGHSARRSRLAVSSTGPMER